MRFPVRHDAWGSWPREVHEEEASLLPLSSGAHASRGNAKPGLPGGGWNEKRCSRDGSRALGVRHPPHEDPRIDLLRPLGDREPALGRAQVVVRTRTVLEPPPLQADLGGECMQLLHGPVAYHVAPPPRTVAPGLVDEDHLVSSCGLWMAPPESPETRCGARAGPLSLGPGPRKIPLGKCCFMFNALWQTKAKESL